MYTPHAAKCVFTGGAWLIALGNFRRFLKPIFAMASILPVFCYGKRDRGKGNHSCQTHAQPNRAADGAEVGAQFLDRARASWRPNFALKKRGSLARSQRDGPVRPTSKIVGLFRIFCVFDLYSSFADCRKEILQADANRTVHHASAGFRERHQRLLQRGGR